LLEVPTDPVVLKTTVPVAPPMTKSVSLGRDVIAPVLKVIVLSFGRVSWLLKVTAPPRKVMLKLSPLKSMAAVEPMAMAPEPPLAPMMTVPEVAR